LDLFLISLQSCLLHFFMWGIAGAWKNHHKRFERLRWYRRNSESEICPC
jgi:hypothetical protein